jgi:hypothetical protein
VSLLVRRQFRSQSSEKPDELLDRLPLPALLLLLLLLLLATFNVQPVRPTVAIAELNAETPETVEFAFGIQSTGSAVVIHFAKTINIFGRVKTSALALTSGVPLYRLTYTLLGPKCLLISFLASCRYLVPVLAQLPAPASPQSSLSAVKFRFSCTAHSCSLPVCALPFAADHISPVLFPARPLLRSAFQIKLGRQSDVCVCLFARRTGNSQQPTLRFDICRRTFALQSD